MFLNISQEDEKIVSNLITDGIFTREQIKEVSDQHNQKLQQLKDLLFNKIYSLDIFNSKISVLNNKFEEIATIALPAKTSKFKIEEWSTWASSTIIFNEENKRVGDFHSKAEDKILIAFHNNQPCLYNSKIFEDKYFCNINNFIFPSIPKIKTEAFPFDLHFLSESNYFCLTDRGSGQLHLIDTVENKLIKTFPIRNPGLNKTINVSFAKNINKFFVTDNISTNLTLIDLKSLEANIVNPGLGILGNLVVAPNQEAIYLISIKPKQSLKLVDIKDYSVKKDFPLKGELFSATDIPYDLLELSIDHKFIYLMTHISDPEPLTPVLTVIETDKEKATQRFSIKDGTKILNIGFAQLNPLHAENKNILDIIVATNLTDIAKIDSVKKQISEEDNNLQIQEDLGFNKPANILETMPGRNNFTISKSENEAKDEEIEWKINLVQEKIEFCNITPGLDDVLYKKCYKQIMTHYGEVLKDLAEKEKWEKVQTETNLRFKAFEKQFLDKDNIMSIRLKDAITKARQELEWHNLAMIRLIGLMTDYNFEISFTREEVLEWIREKERDELIETGLKTIATNCPNCNAQLLGSYSCRSCGFELDKPEDRVRKRLLQISTYHPLDNLPQGHLIITDTLHHKIIETDHFRRIVYELKKDVLHSDIQVELEMPRDAVRLKNNITLVVDYETNRVFKLTQKGRLFWELDYKAHEDNILNKPVSIAAIENGNTVIVDQGNHRIIEVNEEHEIVWRYGKKGVEGIEDNMLRSPTFFQRTKGGTNIITDSLNHRVIEVEGNKIVWQYGNQDNKEDENAYGNSDNQLNTPLTAWKFENGNFLILDSGNHRVIEVNVDKKIVWEYNQVITDEIDRPIKAFRLKTGKIMIISEKNVVEVDYGTKEIIWSASLSELNSASSDSDVTNISENIKKIKVFHGVRNSYTSNKPREIENPVDDKLKNIIEAKKSEIINRTVTRSPVIVTPGSNLSEKDFILLDKTHATVYIIDRKGINKWSFKSDELIKPQGVYYNNSDSVYLTDSETKKVIEIDIKTNSIIWSYHDKNLLSPRSVELFNNSLIISDQIGGKVIEINKADSSIIWEYKDPETLKTPYHALRLANGNTLITDWGMHVVYEVSQDKKVVWHYGHAKKSGNENGFLSYPEYAQRLNNGNTLISDTRNNRIIEVNQDNQIVWTYEGQGIYKLMSPIRATRLDDGHTVIIQSNYKNVIEIDEQGKILWKYLYQDKKI